ncbi:MAG: tRNA uridine-5-carboxymethylaminomethyl(34) synthesis GTPase MnmE [Oscillospiraceae bacterium]|nr:tRNA uridine-5-carboxymethylaminomethyl(34) synthesis GTPase MnmE [Oscillospiraceae bacterium]
MSGTIAALSTPPLSGAIGIIRLSGPEAFSAAAAIFRPSENVPFLSMPPRMLTTGDVILSGNLMDKVCALRLPAPNSYTGEDMVELHLHGSPPLLQSVLEALYASGAKPAAPGEFTRRALMHGKLSLSQAEAVIDLITAETRDSARNAAGQLDGRTGRVFQAVYERLANMLSHFYAVMDYPEEGLPESDLEELARQLELANRDLQKLLGTYEMGRVLREGIRCAIIGRPNVGKSSLLNAFAGEGRAIVSATPGTTRDIIEETVLLGGVKLRLCDSAGIRKKPDCPIETEGLARARTLAGEAELLFVVLDGSAPLGDDDRAVLDLARNRNCVILINKSDLTGVWERDSIEAAFLHIVPVSAKSGDGLDAVGSTLRHIYSSGAVYDGSILTNARQADAIRRTQEAIGHTSDALKQGITPDAVLAELESALSIVSELTGKRVSEDILERIFSQFCVGK